MDKTDTAVYEMLNDSMSLIALGDRITALDMMKRAARKLESAHCTDLNAAWCPVHGDCACQNDELTDEENAALEGRVCPLHSDASGHASWQYHGDQG